MFLLFACAVDADTETDTDTDADADTDTDTDTDTGIAQAWLIGTIATRDGAFEQGTLGVSFLGLSTGASVCDVMGAMVDDGPAPGGCPTCDWAFDLGPVSGSTATGSACDALGVGDGWADGRFDYAWGYTSAYTYAYGGTYYTLDGALLVYAAGAWAPFERGAGAYVRVEGDTTSVSFGRPVISTGYLYYYY